MSVRANRSVALNILSFVLQEVSFFVFFCGNKQREKREKRKNLKTDTRGKRKKKKNEKTTREKNLSTFDKKSNTG